MLDGGSLRQFCIHSYLKASTELTFRLMQGRTGPRDFTRIIIVSPLGRNNGIANGARLQYSTLCQLGVDVTILDAAPALRDPLFRIPHRPGSVYVFHASGPQMACLIRSVLPHAATAYRVAYWAWELPDPPEDWGGCDRNVAEIWTPSAFAGAGLSSLSRKPFMIVPHHISAVSPRRRCADRPFTVLAMADSRSSVARKNPAGAVHAFRMAFGTSRSARLLLKLTTRSADDLSQVKATLGDVSGLNMEIITEFLSSDALTALYRNADVFLSLHRAEGFGLPMLEAMANGVPVVATGWSGNLAFMGPSDSCLVPYRLIPVDDPSRVYRRSVWADPDLSCAARILRTLADDPDAHARLSAAAHRRVSGTAPRFPFALPDHASAGRLELQA